MTTIPCPFCNSPIPIDSTICVRCGKQGGERLERVRNAVIEEEAKAAEEKANARREIEQRRIADDEKRQARIRKRANGRERLLVFAKTRRGFLTVFSGLLVLVLGLTLTIVSWNPAIAALFCGRATLTNSGVMVSQSLDGGLLGGTQIPDSESVACVWRTLGFGKGGYHSMKWDGVPNREKHGEYFVSVSRSEGEVTWVFFRADR
jgi:hypothetical protein